MSPAPTRSGRLMLEVAEGRGAGALLENGFLEQCLEAGLGVHILTPGARFEPFVNRYARDGVRFSYLPVDRYGVSGRWPNLEHALGRRLLRAGLPRARRMLWRAFGERFTLHRAGKLADLLNRERPDLFVSTNSTLGFDLGLVGLSRRLGIPTLGNIFSWDHPYRQHVARPDHLTCWSEWVKDELVARQGYEASRIEVIGAPAFDPYFREGYVWSREKLCTTLGLDPARPILLFASLGQMRAFLDETGTFRALMAAVDSGRIGGKPQVVLRLHPLSLDQYFADYIGRDDIVVSRYTGYCPGMRWWPSADEVALAGNLLRHADLCVSPGSTITVETAIFDVPTIIPVFNPYNQEEHLQFFTSHWLDQHFRFIVEDALLPVVSSEDEMVDAVNRVLVEREWDASGQARIRERMLGPLDGQAAHRLADAAVRLARSQPRAASQTNRRPSSAADPTKSTANA